MDSKPDSKQLNSKQLNSKQLNSKQLKDLAKALEAKNMEVMIWDPSDMTEADKVVFMEELERRQIRNQLRKLGLPSEGDV